MPSNETTAPARRSRMAMDHVTVQRAAEVEEKLRQRIKVRRIMMRPQFHDMDRTQTGHVSRSQFARTMSRLGFELDAGSMWIVRPEGLADNYHICICIAMYIYM